MNNVFVYCELEGTTIADVSLPDGRREQELFPARPMPVCISSPTWHYADGRGQPNR